MNRPVWTRLVVLQVAAIALVACGAGDVDREPVAPCDYRAVSGQAASRDAVLLSRERHVDGGRQECPEIPTLTVQPVKGGTVTYRGGRQTFDRCAEGAHSQQDAAAGGAW
jgi:hypothetical protein